MSTKLTFSQYLDSKEKLRDAVKQTPQRTAEYKIRKYCKLPVGHNKQTKEYVNLKPNDKVSVHWLYEDFDNPTVVSLKFETKEDAFDQTALWSGERLLKWLHRNAQEIC